MTDVEMRHATMRDESMTDDVIMVDMMDESEEEGGRATR